MKRKGNPTALIVLAVILFLAAIAAAVVGFSGPAELKNVKDVKASEMSTSYSYEIEELVIVDHYMTITGDNKGDSNGKYYIAGFYGDDGKFYITSLHANGDEDLQEKLDDYINDAEANIGDLIIRGCFKTRKVSAVDSDEEIYGPFVSKVKSMFLGELISSEDTKLHLDYVCEYGEDYASKASTTPIIIVAFVLAGLGVALIFAAKNVKKKIKAEEEARARFNENQPETPEF